jgi:hypothetical protein
LVLSLTNCTHQSAPGSRPEHVTLAALEIEPAFSIFLCRRGTSVVRVWVVASPWLVAFPANPLATRLHVAAGTVAALTSAVRIWLQNDPHVTARSPPGAASLLFAAKLEAGETL